MAIASQTDAASPVQHMQGAGAVNNPSAVPVGNQPAPAAQPVQPQQPAQAPPQPGYAAGAGLQFGNAPPGIDPAMWASLDAATASAIQVKLPKATAISPASGISC